MPKTIFEHAPLAAAESSIENAHVIERVVIEDGIKIYLKGYPYPLAGYPTSDAVSAINIIKCLARSLVRFRNILCLSDTRRTFTTVSMHALRSHVLRREYMHPVARELRTVFARIADEDIACIVSHVIEYDSAYRVRIHDALAQVSQDAMVRTPLRALWIMVMHNRRNDYAGVHAKMVRVVMLLTIALLVPWFRRRWRGGWAMADFGRFHLDDASAYWLSVRTDYGPSNMNPIPPSLYSKVKTSLSNIFWYHA